MERHIRWSDIKPEALSPLLERQFVTTQNVTLARFRLRKGVVIPEHSHVNEQLTSVLEGALKLIFPGREVVVRAGEVACIPPHLPHAAEAMEDTIVLDVFSPPRADWLQGDDAYLRGTSK
ncbi:MAG TPA: cupin domain-containing protein [Terriglobales bacterium]|nr:cupin domain-containing protein [Terriglobales bacterium]